MPSTRSGKHGSSSEDTIVIPPVRPPTKRPTTVTTTTTPPRKKAAPVPRDEIIEISSDEDEVVMERVPPSRPPLINTTRHQIPPIRLPAIAKTSDLEQTNTDLKRQLALASERAQLLEYQLDQLKQQRKKTLADIEESILCEICMQKMWYPWLIRECDHAFCESCLASWFTSVAPNLTCPLCRSKVDKRPMDINSFFIRRVVGSVSKATSSNDDNGDGDVEAPRRDKKQARSIASHFKAPAPAPLLEAYGYGAQGHGQVQGDAYGLGNATAAAIAQAMQMYRLGR